jgi:protein SCO1
MKYILYIITATLLISLAWYIQQLPFDDGGNRYAHLGGNFTLQGGKGNTTLEQFKGRPVILYFGFTSCPDVCPLSLQQLNKSFDKTIPNDRKNIQVIFISVDWKRDTPKKVDQYAKFFSDEFIGLTGTKDEIDFVVKKYAAFYEFVPLKESSLGYTVDHSSRYYMIDKKGVLRNSYTDSSSDEFKKLVKQLIKENI